MGATKAGAPVYFLILILIFILILLSRSSGIAEGRIKSKKKIKIKIETGKATRLAQGGMAQSLDVRCWLLVVGCFPFRFPFHHCFGLGALVSSLPVNL